MRGPQHDYSRAPRTLPPQAFSHVARTPPGHVTACYASPLNRLGAVIGNRAFGAVVQAKLAVSMPGDRFELEADRLADAVTRTPDTAVMQRSCGGCSAGSPCAECEDDDETLIVQRREASASAIATADMAVPNLGPGRPLDAASRAYFEPRFGCDFGHVRVHDGRVADESAQSVNARAYTVGHRVVFAAGEYAPSTAAGRWLLAHELTHVLQQGAGSAVRRSVRPAFAGAHAHVRERARGAMLQRAGPIPRACDHLLRAQEATRVGGIAAHTAIALDFITQVGRDNARRFRIPGATADPVRLGCGDDAAGASEEPEVFNTLGAYGIPDLAYRDGNSREVAEIKPATFPCVDMGERQVRRYVDQGNRARSWLRDRGFTSLRLMDPGRFAPMSPISVGAEPVTVAWCGPGLLVYKAIRDQDPAIFVCGTSDQGKIDQFLDNALGRAQGLVDQYITKKLEPALTRMIQSMSLRDMIRTIYRYARGTLEQVLNERLGPGAAGILPSNATADQVADIIAKVLGPHAEQAVRSILATVKYKLLTEVRERMQAGLRSLLQTGLNALCATAATVTLAALMDWLAKQMRRFMVETIGQILVAAAAAVLTMVMDAILAELQAAVRVLKMVVEKVLEFLKILAIVVAFVALAVLFVIAVLDLVPGDEVAVLAGMAALAVAVGLTSGEKSAGEAAGETTPSET